MAHSSSFWSKIIRWFKPSSQHSTHDNNASNTPAQYWPEVQHFLEDFRALVIENTEAEQHKVRMNQQVLSYLEKQIEIKGRKGTEDDKIHELEVIADRILTTTMNKFVGMKPHTTQTTEFSDLVNKFKQELHSRKETH